ncbi:MAG: hypothetical protein U0797_08575 [Gemmataceae bacterium]
MSATTIIVPGVVHPDGTLEVREKLPLPPGQVQVTVVAAAPPATENPFWKRMQDIWDARKAAGLAPRSERQVEEERQRARDEWEDRLRQVGRGLPGDAAP